MSHNEATLGFGRSDTPVVFDRLLSSCLAAGFYNRVVVPEASAPLQSVV